MDSAHRSAPVDLCTSRPTPSAVLVLDNSGGGFQAVVPMPLPEHFDELVGSETFMIYLPRHRARAEYSLGKLHEVGIANVTLFEGLDGFTQDPRPAAQAEGLVVAEEALPGEVALAVTTLRLWKEMVGERRPYAVIFEDDVLPHPEIARLGPLYWHATPRELDFLFLGSEMTVAGPSLGDTLVVEVPAQTTHAYVVTLEGAQRGLALVNIQSRLLGHETRCIDVDMAGWMRAGHVRFRCWNGSRLARPFPVPPDLACLESMDVAAPGRDTGLFYQNLRMGSTIWSPEIVWSMEAPHPGPHHRSRAREKPPPKRGGSPRSCCA